MSRKRINRDKMFMEIAFEFAERGTCPRAQVGAVVVNGDHHILSHGYNGAPGGMTHCEEIGCGGKHPFIAAGEVGEFPDGCTRAVHAEANAIAYAAALGVPLRGATMYTTHQPCLACAKLIISARIGRVWFYEPYRLNEGLELLKENGTAVHKLDYNKMDEEELGLGGINLL